MPALPLPSLLPASLRSLSGRSIPVSFSLSQAHFSWLRLGYREERTGRAKGQEGLTDKSLEPRDEAAVKRREMREEQGMRKR